MVRPTFIDINPVELKYYPFVVSLNKCPQICIPKENKLKEKA